MTHEESIRTHVSERYLLGDLSSEAREDFEAHYFECAECAEEVRLGMLLADNAKAAFQDPDLRRRRRPSPATEEERAPLFPWLRVRQWASALAACLFAAGLAYDDWEIRQLQKPQIGSSIVLRAASRGEAQVLPLAKGDRFLELTLDTDLPANAAGFQCDVLTEAGRPVVSLPVPASAVGGGSLRLRLPAAQFPNGRYVAVLRSAQREVDRFPFTLNKE